MKQENAHHRQESKLAAPAGRVRERSILSRRSRRSILSCGSAGSILSIGSAGSILSIGSAGSILSVFSIGSILSVVSVGSLLSILGYRTIRNRKLRKDSLNLCRSALERKTTSRRPSGSANNEKELNTALQRHPLN